MPTESPTRRHLPVRQAHHQPGPIYYPSQPAYPPKSHLRDFALGSVVGYFFARGSLTGVLVALVLIPLVALAVVATIGVLVVEYFWPMLLAISALLVARRLQRREPSAR